MDDTRSHPKVIGVAVDGLNIDWMNQEKKEKAGMLIALMTLQQHHFKVPLITLLILEP